MLHVQDAVAEAELLPVAHERGDGRQRVVLEEHLSGLVHVALPVQCHALRHGSVNRTTLQPAFGLLTKQAA